METSHNSSTWWDCKWSPAVPFSGSLKELLGGGSGSVVCSCQEYTSVKSTCPECVRHWVQNAATEKAGILGRDNPLIFLTYTKWQIPAISFDRDGTIIQLMEMRQRVELLK